MAYQKQTWINLPDKTTPISADRLNHMEDGIEAIDTELENIDTHLTDYVKNTDYASTTGGVIKVSVGQGTATNTNGYLVGEARTYTQYGSSADTLFVCKGTLENVITGKGLVSNTSYATGDTGGVIKSGNQLGINSTNGIPYCSSRTYEQYTNDTTAIFISKGTLENVLNEKIGDIQTLLDNLDVGSGVNGN